jgi:AraC-like DNA-binding protein
VQLNNFKLAQIQDLDELESGVYWPRLQPYFAKPYFRRLTYQLTSRRSLDCRRGEILSTRGASGFGELDIAYIADRCSTTMRITEAGLPDYCLTLVSRGSLACLGTSTPGSFEANEAFGLIYRGLPGMALSASQDHERLAIWIPAASLQKRLAGLVGGAVTEDIVFDPIFDLGSVSGLRIKRLIWLLTEEFGTAHPFAGNEIACKSFTDLLLYSMLQVLPHNHSWRLARAMSSPVPGTVRRAEDYVRSHAAQPIALHEIANVAGCSVRALQLAFRQFRDTTPTAAIVRARLEAVREALRRREISGTVTEIALRYGFTNPGRFTRLYRTAFGASLLEELQHHPPR